MKIITIDFETYWATDYTLSKMSTSAYIADPRFQMIMVAVKVNASPAQVLNPAQWEVFYKSVDWSEVYILCHHTHFDGLILALYYGVNPRGWLDTLSMSRALDGPHAKHGLEELAKRYHAGEKGKEVYNTKGKRLEDFTAYEYQEYMKYSANDANLTFAVFKAMMKRGFPATELELIDIVIRMFTEPKFQLEVSEVQEHLDWERERKQALLDRLEQEKKSVSGNKTFAGLLVEKGIDPPLKYSVNKSEKAGHAVMDYAFAKTDPGFQDLLEHEDEEVRLLAEARVSVKSTQTESRSQRMIDMAARYEYLPVYLVVGAAHTHRLGGGDKVNWQNFERTDKKNPRKGKIRKAIKAPEGHKIVVADSAQIEARKVAYLAGHESLLTQFRNGEDVYSKFASVLYGRVVDRKNNPEDEIAGHVGKCQVLGLGYGMGWVKLASEMARGMLSGPVVIFDEKFLEVLNFDPSRFLSNPNNIDKVKDMPSRIPLRQRLIHCAVSNHIVKTYRETNKPIQDLHKFHEKVLQLMVEEFVGVVEHAGVPINIDRHKIILPNGLCLHYKGITKDDRGFTYFNGRNVVYLHGGVVTENRTQALCRILITDPMRVLQREYNAVKGMTHDEIIQVVPTPIAQECFTRTLKLMATPPDWCKGLPIKAEGGIGDRYGSIK